ncbi:MAG: ATP-dependent RNA helicase DbpA [Shewanella sp.]|nr:ATP-dependent RNA helicase DbpA [Shewanella sp.]MCF1458325.1 ATP-dependent RNA helicase DbpA [Shewanella sp.]
MAFASLSLKPQLLSTLDSIGYAAVTPIQAASLPLILAGKDVIAQGKTGSGKTAAFGLGLLDKLDVKRFRIQSLVLCPTRELADQVAKEIRTLARGIHNIKVLTLCGGVPVGPQIGSLEHGAHIIVGTPGRVLDHIQQGRLDFSELTTLVLDEADRMLEMGFTQAMDSIIAETPAGRQTLLFSATFPAQIQGMAERIMRNPEMVKLEATHDSQSITQHFYHLEEKSERMQALKILLCKVRPESAVVFCNTKRETQSVADELAALGFSALALHGDQEQRERDRTLVQFANKSINVLVATDVAARGLDIDNLDAVVNFEMAYDREVHIHRIGRTGRAGSLGQAFSFYTGKDSFKITALEEVLGYDIQDDELPGEQYLNIAPYKPKMTTIVIDGGKKQKLRPGDILGALTADKTMTGGDIGKIKITDIRSFVAVKRQFGKKALTILNKGKLKGRQFRAFSVY